MDDEFHAACTALVFVDLVLWSAGKDLFLAPVGHVAKRFAADKFGKRRFVRPFAGNQVGRTGADVFPQC